MALINRARQIIPTTIKNRILSSPVERVLSPLYIHSSEFGDFIFPTPQGDVQLNLPRNVSFANVASCGEFYEPELVNAMANSAISDGVFFDVGARYGFSSSAAALCGVDDANIHAFESSYLNLQILRRNLPDSNIVYGWVGDGNDGTVSLTHYACDNNIDPKGIKIDVEGAERLVLCGLSPLVEECMPVLFIEVHPQKIGTKEADELVEGLTEYGYDILMADHHRDGSDWCEYTTSPTEEFLIWCR